MFQTLKKIFTKKQKTEAKDSLAGKVIKFKDSYGQECEMSIEIDGNNNVLLIKEIKNNYKLAFDKETATIVGYVLNYYAAKNNINGLVNLFEEEGNK